METGTATGDRVGSASGDDGCDCLLVGQEVRGCSALRFRRNGGWEQLSYAEMGEAAAEIAAGLTLMGVEVSDRVCILANTCHEWSPATSV